MGLMDDYGQLLTNERVKGRVGGLLNLVGDMLGTGQMQGVSADPRNWSVDDTGRVLNFASGLGLSTKGPKQTVTDPVRNAFPGIYERPDVIAKTASERVAPENPAMKQLFGVTRDDLYQIRQSRGPGNEAPNVKMAANPKGAAVADQITNRKNTKRIVDVLSEAEKYPELVKGMDAWYEMGPLWDRLAQISDDPVRDFKNFQAFTGMASPNADVLNELNRGTAALYSHNNGLFSTFAEHGGVPQAKRGADFPEYLRGVGGHMAHSTAHVKPMQKYIENGVVTMDSPKVPLYVQSAGVPETGYQTAWPVGDAHWARGVGLADVRNDKEFAASISTPELASLGPWWDKKVAKALGTNSVNAQARAWGTFAPATGVKTSVGAPKLELISQKIMDAARAYGISPEQARDLMLQGQLIAPNLGMLGIKK